MAGLSETQCQIEPTYVNRLFCDKTLPLLQLRAQIRSQIHSEQGVIRTAQTAGQHLYSSDVFVSLLKDYLDNKAHFFLFNLTAGISSFSIICMLKSFQIFRKHCTFKWRKTEETAAIFTW